VQQHCFLRTHRTCDYSQMLATACCFVGGVRVRFSAYGLVSGYAHEFVLRSVVIVPHPTHEDVVLRGVQLGKMEASMNGAENEFSSQACFVGGASTRCRRQIWSVHGDRIICRRVTRQKTPTVLTHALNQTINKSISQSINQWINQSINETITQWIFKVAQITKSHSIKVLQAERLL